MKRKGRPKQPAPTFHLPSDLWDHSTFPTLRPKDSNGLPLPNSTGLVLFRFHIDDSIVAAYPSWARGLYENPPLPAEDSILPTLPEVMNASMFTALKPRIKLLRDASTVSTLTPAEISDINSRPDDLFPSDIPDDLPSTHEDLNLDFVSSNLESFVAMAAAQASNPDPFLYLAPVGNEGPSAGSSIRARKQAKRLGGEMPGGAATPVAKRLKGDGDVGIEGDLEGDASFLDGL